MGLLRAFLLGWQPSGSTIRGEGQMRMIEDYRPGYPRFTALFSAYDHFFLVRRFNRIRARLLLLKQDKLSLLEQRLDQIDQDETALLFLGKSRCDENTNRTSLLAEIESSLADYDQFVERTHRTLSLNPAERRDVQSLQNWVDGTCCLAREETEYLANRKDLISLAPCGDSAVLTLEAWVEDKFVRFCRGFRNNRYHDVSTDANVFIYSGSLIKQTARSFLLSLIVFLLVMPVIICNFINTISIRIIIIIVSTIFYLVIISGLTKSRTMELILAGATYAAVLIVFVSGTSTIDS